MLLRFNVFVRSRCRQLVTGDTAIVYFSFLTQCYFSFFSFHNASSYSLRLISPIGESPKSAC